MPLSRYVRAILKKAPTDFVVAEKLGCAHDRVEADEIARRSRDQREARRYAATLIKPAAFDIHLNRSLRENLEVRIKAELDLKRDRIVTAIGLGLAGTAALRW